MSLIILLFFTLGLILGIWGIITEDEDIFFVFFSIIVSLIIGFFIALGIQLFVEATFESDYVPYKTVEIHAFSNTNEISGNFAGGFLLHSGSIESEMFYHYIAETKMGGKSIFKVSVNQASILETDGTPQAVWYKNEFINPTIEKHFGIFKGSFVKFYVPENTIKESFNISI